MAASKQVVPAHRVVRRWVSLYLVFVLTVFSIGQQFAVAETRTEEPGSDPAPPVVVDDEDDSASDPPPEPPVTNDPPPAQPQPTEADTQTDPPPVVPTIPVPDSPLPTTEPTAIIQEPELPVSQPTLPVDDPVMPTLPPAEPTSEPTATETPTPEPTARPVNVDTLSAVDVSAGVVLEPGQSWQFDYVYSVSTSRVGTSLSAGLEGDTGGWSITLYAGSGQSVAGQQVATADQTALSAGGSFGVSVVITAPVDATTAQAVSYWITSTATPDDGAPEEAGASAAGPTITVQPPATPTPTATATPSPTPSPTPEPPIPFAPTLACAPVTDAATPGGNTTWHLDLCTVTWETQNVTLLQASASTDSDDWSAMALPGDATAPSELTTGQGGPVTITFDAETRSGQFAIATQAGCRATEPASVSVELTATSTTPTVTGENGAVPTSDAEASTVETSLLSVNATGHGNSAPDVTVGEASFQPVDVSDSREPSRGTIRIDYSNAPTGCPWELTVTLADLTGGDHVIPASRLEVIEVNGTGNPAYVVNDGAIVITTAEDSAGTGSITIVTSLDIPAEIPPGTYSTTVTAGARVLP